MNNTFLEIKNISKTFPGVKALSDVNFSIKKGEVHALIGENGAGKSTLIKILTGVYQADDGGEIFINGKKVTLKNSLESLEKGIAVIYQDFSLFLNLSVAENIGMGLEVEKKKKFFDWKNVRLKAKEALDLIDLDIDLDTPVGELSIAKQQMIAIARSLVCDASLIIMDEPTATLSKEETKILLSLIKKIQKTGVSILFVSHKLEELFEVADVFTVLRDGNYIGTYPANQIDEKKLITLMVGRQIFFERKTRKIGDSTLLEVKNLSKRGNFKDISFSLKKGEILGITGIVGAGRTEMMEAIYGATSYDSGEIFIEDKKIVIKNTKDALKNKIAFVPEDRKNLGLVLNKTIEDNIVISNLKKISSKFGKLNFDLKFKEAESWIEKLDIRPKDCQLQTKKLSGGNQQKVVIGKCLSTNPKILIIDEPTNGIDIGAKTNIHDLLRELADDGMGIIMISSDLPEVLAVSDRILVMRKGKITGEFLGEEATQESIINKAILN